MAAFIIASVLVTDDKWVPEYAARVHEIAAKHGGKYLSRSGNIEVLEGNPGELTLIALIQFPSKEAAKAFATDPEYAPFGKARQAGKPGDSPAIGESPERPLARPSRRAKLWSVISDLVARSAGDYSRMTMCAHAMSRSHATGRSLGFGFSGPEPRRPPDLGG